MDTLTHRVRNRAHLYQTDAVDRCLAETRGEGRRLLLFIAANPRALTHTVRAECQIGNLSRAVISLNHKLSRYGWHVVGELPDVLTHTSAGARSMQRQWRLERV